MKCLECGTTTTNTKFCSSSCNASYQNRNNHWRNKPEHKQEPNDCAYCGTKLDKLHKKYCTLKCQGAHTRQIKIAHWKVTGKLSKGPVKAYLAEKREGCWECGITSWNNKEIVLDLEHIDGDSSNNAEENLALLCPNCHSQTPTYKGKNAGNGRAYRRERYAEGKSY